MPFMHLVAPACVVSYPHALDMNVWPGMPCILDSGAFGFLRGHGVSWEHGSEGAVIRLEFGDRELEITPSVLLRFMEDRDLWGFTPDVPVPPGTDASEAAHRLDASLESAAWMVDNARGRRLWVTIPVYEDIQAVLGAINIAAAMDAYGIALGGLVPRFGEPWLVDVVRHAVSTGKPVHVLGVGAPDRVFMLWSTGVASVDSSTYARQAASGMPFLGEPVDGPSTLEIRNLMLRNLAFMNQASMGGAWKVLLMLKGTGDSK